MRRRELIASLASAAVALPMAAGAQQPATPARIGVTITNPRNPVGTYKGLFAGLHDLGLIQGKNLIAQIVELEQPQPALFAAVGKLVRSGPQLLVASGPAITLQAAASAAGTRPIVVIALNYDPITLGYAKSLARPGGNATGVFVRQPELAEKQVELLSQAFPDRRRLGILGMRFRHTSSRRQTVRQDRSGLDPVAFKDPKNPPDDYATAFTALAERAPQLLTALSSPFFTESSERIAELAIHHQLPSMFIFKG